MKDFFLSQKPRIGISACLLGQKVRHNGRHKRDLFVTEILSRFVEWVPVCPEVEAGMGVPRETVRLVGNPSHPRMVADRSGKDWSRQMEAYSRKRLKKLSSMNLSGYILKKNSPSCGMERVKVYGKGGAPKLKGRGLFARSLMTALPLLPVEEEGRLNDLALRANFIARVFAYHRWQNLLSSARSPRPLIKFHKNKHC